ncbi:MAG: helix-hairpin-helix domain-containing protein [Chitinophagales bacterium]
MSNKEIAKIFKLLAGLTELHGGNTFRIRSYASVSRKIGSMGTQLADVPNQQLSQLEGIGSNTAQKITTLLQTGSFPALNDLLEKTPKGVLDVMNIKGLGAKKVKVLWEDLGIESLGELLYACAENRLITLKGFGVKTQANIKKSVEYVLANVHKYRYAKLEPEALSLLADFDQMDAFEQVSFTGAIRRRCEVLERIEILVASDDIRDLEDACESLDIAIEQQDEAILQGKTGSGTPIVLYHALPRQYVYRLFETTGSVEHIEQLKSWFSFPDFGLQSEEDLYERCGQPFIVPEMREPELIMAPIRGTNLPQLITLSDIKGIIHSHSTYSDGRHKLADMAKACQKLGYEYLAISDHSKSAFYANGLNEARIEAQHREIDQLNGTFNNFRIFKSIESDILSDGRLDYDVDVLEQFDFVIASIHFNLKMPEERAMRRLITAIENPYTSMLGHPTGRLILSRPGYPINHKKIIDACAANGVVIELNANPHRLDIDWRWIPYCMEKGVMISINPDAHSKEGIKDVRYGVYAARKGGLSKDMTFNAKSRAEIENYFRV